jgi:hypothetical protein
MAKPTEPDPAYHSAEAKKILSELKDKGITDLETLVKAVTQNSTAAAQPRRVACDPHHWCIWHPLQ